MFRHSPSLLVYKKTAKAVI